MFTSGSRRLSRASQRTARVRTARQWLLLLLALAIIAASAVVVRQHRDDIAAMGGNGPENLPSVAFPAGGVEAADANRALDASGRQVYRYSVIPGGAYSAQELARAIARDPVVSSEYAGVRLANLQVKTLTAPRTAYVTYRKGDRVYWTSRQVTLNAGETILTDGVTEIRARCGNCISVQPMQPAAEEEPDLAELDRLEPGLLASRAPGIDPTATPGIPIGASPLGFGGAPSAGLGGMPFAGVPIGGPSSLRTDPAGAPADGAPDGGLPPNPGDNLPPGVGPPGGPGGDTPPGGGPGDEGPDGPGPDGPGPDTPGPDDPGPDDPGPDDPDDPGDDPDTGTIPEPGTLLLFAGGTAAWLVRRRIARGSR